MNEVKGDDVINQLKGYAERLSNATESSSMVSIRVWHYKWPSGSNQQPYSVKLTAFNSDTEEYVLDCESADTDLRKIGEAIDKYINGKGRNENG